MSNWGQLERNELVALLSYVHPGTVSDCRFINVERGISNPETRGMYCRITLAYKMAKREFSSSMVANKLRRYEEHFINRDLVTAQLESLQLKSSSAKETTLAKRLELYYKKQLRRIEKGKLPETIQ